MSGTKYEVLAETKNVRIIAIFVKCTWTVQPTPLEIHVTVDGQALIGAKTDPVSNDWYSPDRPTELGTGFAVGVSSIIPQPFLLEGRNVKVEVEITGGTVSNLSARVKYAKIP